MQFIVSLGEFAGKTVLLDCDGETSSLDDLPFVVEFSILKGSKFTIFAHLIDRIDAFLVLMIGLIGKGKVAVVADVRIRHRLNCELVTKA